MTDVTVVATTWLPPGKEEARLDAFYVALASWAWKLNNGGASVHLHLADDGTEERRWESLQATVIGLWSRGEVTFSQQARRGVGASLNAGLRAAFERSPVALHAVDDWELLAPLDLTPWVAFLESERYDAGMVRFFPHPDLTGTVRYVPPHGWAVALDRHHFAFGLRPCLWHPRFFEAFGWFDEGLNAYETEQRFNLRVTQHLPLVEGERIWLALPEQWRPIETESLAGIVPG